MGLPFLWSCWFVVLPGLLGALCLFMGLMGEMVMPFVLSCKDMERLSGCRHRWGPKRRGGGHIWLLVVVDGHVWLLVGSSSAGKEQPARSVQAWLFLAVSSLHNWLFLELFTLALLSFMLTFHISIGILIAVGSIEWYQDSSTTYITQYKWHGIFEEVNISSTEPRHPPVSMDSFFVMNWQI
jgi:hypothetical protein